MITWQSILGKKGYRVVNYYKILSQEKMLQFFEPE